MTTEEIEELLAAGECTTLCMVDPDGKPYAIEFNYFLDHGDICGLVHPRGKTADCLAANPSVCAKVCNSDARRRSYRGVSCFGKAFYENLTDPDEVAWAWDSLEQQLNLTDGEYLIYKKCYLNSGRALPLLRILVEECTGVTSRPKKKD